MQAQVESLNIITKESDGINFYTDLSTGEAGLDAAGIAYFTGVSEEIIQKIIYFVTTNKPDKLSSKSLKELAVSELFLDKDKHIFKVHTAWKIIEYFALDFNPRSEVALFSYRRFSVCNLTSLVHTQVGYTEDIVNDLIELDVFPEEFFIELYRLRKWDYITDRPKNKPIVAGKYVRELIYLRLPNEYYSESNRRSYKEIIDLPKGAYALFRQVYLTIGIMKVHTQWEKFIKDIDRLFPITRY